MGIRAEYDPVKAREYYLRNRELKGRQAKSVDQPTSRIAGGPKPTAKRSFKLPPTKPIRLNTKAETERRVSALKARLDELKLVLKRLVAEAKGRSGVTPVKDAKDNKAPGGGSVSDKAERKTSSEKAKLAKAAKDYYDKLNPESAVLKEIQAVQKRIELARKKLEDSVQRARGKAAVKSVSNRPKN